MISAAMAVAVLLTLSVPHVLPLTRADPASAVLLWSANLGLRALLGVHAAIWLVLFLPATELFSAMTHWCWHEVLPLLTTHLGFDGHSVGDAVVVLPAVVLVVSLLSVGLGVWRVARTVRRMVARAELGQGPRGSVIVGGEQVLVAAAGIGRPKVLISAGALTCFDDDELAAALDHERGHIARRHRYILLYAQGCRALGRFVPGTGRVMAELLFHLERDADRWALRNNDRFALASAIIKAAEGTRLGPSPAVLALSGAAQLQARLGALVEARPPSRTARRAARLAGITAATAAAVLALAVPATIAAGMTLPAVPTAHDCPS